MADVVESAAPTESPGVNDENTPEVDPTTIGRRSRPRVPICDTSTVTRTPRDETRRRELPVGVLGLSGTDVNKDLREIQSKMPVEESPRAPPQSQYRRGFEDQEGDDVKVRGRRGSYPAPPVSQGGARGRAPVASPHAGGPIGGGSEAGLPSGRSLEEATEVRRKICRAELAREQLEQGHASLQRHAGHAAESLRAHAARLAHGSLALRDLCALEAARLVADRRKACAAAALVLAVRARRAEARRLRAANDKLAESLGDTAAAKLETAPEDGAAGSASPESVLEAWLQLGNDADASSSEQAWADKDVQPENGVSKDDEKDEAGLGTRQQGKRGKADVAGAQQGRQQRKRGADASRGLLTGPLAAPCVLTSALPGAPYGVPLLLSPCASAADKFAAAIYDKRDDEGAITSGAQAGGGGPSGAVGGRSAWGEAGVPDAVKAWEDVRLGKLRAEADVAQLKAALKAAKEAAKEGQRLRSEAEASATKTREKARALARQCADLGRHCKRLRSGGEDADSAAGSRPGSTGLKDKGKEEEEASDRAKPALAKRGRGRQGANKKK
mmetsp:Transcript_27725/g.61877  ORF Transcript_27725/g.61877 Transcript_27725/m.61877 type:complete len:558 (+) Transcript_27725:72-1745(+)